MVMCCVNNSTCIDTMVFFQETHTFAATVLVKAFCADPLHKFESGECAILAQELGADLLPEYKDGECAITQKRSNVCGAVCGALYILLPPCSKVYGAAC